MSELLWRVPVGLALLTVLIGSMALSVNDRGQWPLVAGMSGLFTVAVAAWVFG